MQELTPQQKKKLLRLAKIADKGEVAIIEELDSISDQFEALDEKLDGVFYIAEEVKNTKDGYTPVKGVDYVDGKDGRNPLTVSKTAPINPQKGDLWYKN